eukprot:TRINITY_DN22235_c0_g1_i1.p1 TRINITY_DN22235_c0_g1~~TRINITY_DN22235_c0_g1_i1.p1  ORF type:complete len:300 (-),score=25.91 TRINITY_DN22235_c0_g1_i1:26-925(-)
MRSEALTGRRPTHSSTQVVALPSIVSASERGGTISGSLQSGGAALAPVTSSTNADAESHSYYSEDEDEPGLDIRPTPIVSRSKLSVAAAWARAAHLAATRDASDSESESSSSDVELKALADSSSQIAVAAAEARSIFAAATEVAPSAKSEPQSNRNVEPELSGQHVFPAILRQDRATTACSGSSSSAGGMCSTGSTEGAEDLKSSEIPEQKNHAILGRKRGSAHRRKSVRFAPMPECKGSEMASPGSVVASENDKQGRNSLRAKFGDSQASHKSVRDQHGGEFGVIGKPGLGVIEQASN